MKKKITVSWSGGKDSAFALYKILNTDEFEVVSLHTVFNAETKRVGMHGVHETLIEAQAESLGIPLQKLYLPASESHAEYEKLMKDFYNDCKLKNIEGVLFGDIFLEDLKIFRKSLLSPSGLKAYFPLWKISSDVLLDDFIGLGFKTLICAASAKYFSKEDVGKTIDHRFRKNLPDDVDPCGENGEFHTFVYDGPGFRSPIEFLKAEVVEKSYSYSLKDENGNDVKTNTSFWFQELSPRRTW